MKKGSKFYITRINEEHCICLIAYCNLNKLAIRKYFFDLLKTTLNKHDIQSGQSFWDGGSIW